MESTAEDIQNAIFTHTCVIVPTYNNSRTLARVLDGVLKKAGNVIVVNDGSTDDTRKILDTYQNIIRIDFESNSGKGMALRKGFEKAKSLGFHYAITIDSDGQHFPSDIPVFINELVENGEALLIGSRNMKHATVPKKSSFGNQFSNFWFWVETGIRLNDTQSGYRLYPLKRIPEKFYTRKFEFEIEIIVRTAWKGVPVRNIPVNILYDADERVSHFRPFKDFTRISILNTILVLNTFFYIRPRNLIQKLRAKGFRKFFSEDILSSTDSNARKACAIALGVFIGIAPIWGFQTVVVLFLAAIFRLNKIIAFTFSNISIPPLIPFIIYGSMMIGETIIPSGQPLDINRLFALSQIQNNIWQYLIGSLILASAAALVFGLTSFLVLSTLNSKNRK